MNINKSDIRGILDKYGKLSVAAADVSDDTDLFTVGLTSHATVNVMLGLEDLYDVEFPEEILKKSTFSSVNSLASALSNLVAAGV
ncbi:acyl carrier protein [Gordonia sp. 852002-51296_SCH5728562-b]|uniref:acyl carrier protein n=1 Tax=Gordonia sp. 852002-51296_SCH5728562-b TaxID=1834101 RepID=UPI0009EE1D46|nr:acyl carrier protein [Gordonia sp. 852002-51296_SCH5728562-b]